MSDVDVGNIISKIKKKPTRKKRAQKQKKESAKPIVVEVEKQEPVADMSLDQDLSYLDNLSPEMVKSLRLQAGLPELKVFSVYPYCMKHGFINPTDPNAARRFCSICGCKMIDKKYLGEL